MAAEYLIDGGPCQRHRHGHDPQPDRANGQPDRDDRPATVNAARQRAAHDLRPQPGRRRATGAPPPRSPSRSTGRARRPRASPPTRTPTTAARPEQQQPVGAGQRHRSTTPPRAAATSPRARASSTPSAPTARASRSSPPTASSTPSPRPATPTSRSRRSTCSPWATTPSTSTARTPRATGATTASTTLVIERTPPAIISVNRVDPTPTTAASVSLPVTFSESVVGGTSANFTLVSGGGLTGAIDHLRHGHRRHPDRDGHDRLRSEAPWASTSPPRRGSGTSPATPCRPQACRSSARSTR